MAKSISQLDSAVSVSNDDLFETAVPDLQSETGYASKKHSLAAMANHIGTQVGFTGLNTTAQTLVGAINELASTGGGTEISATLSPNTAQVLVMDESILANSKIDIYVDTWGVAPTNVVAAVGSVTMTFERQQNTVNIKLVIH